MDSTRRTYSELRNDPFADDREKDDALVDEVLGLMSTTLVRRGLREPAGSLLQVVNAEIELDPQDGSHDLWLEYEPEDRATFESNLELLRDVFGEVVRRKEFPIGWLCVREVMPDVKFGWREQLEAALGVDGKRPTNHARKVRPNRPQHIEDWLAFTNAEEKAVYQALKRKQEALPREETITIYPLAGCRLPGRTWEPDFLITYRGRAGILEVDGPHHNARRAMDISRDHLFHDAGAAYTDRVPVEVQTSSAETDAVIARFLRRLAECR